MSSDSEDDHSEYDEPTELVLQERPDTPSQLPKMPSKHSSQELRLQGTKRGPKVTDGQLTGRGGAGSSGGGKRSGGRQGGGFGKRKAGGGGTLSRLGGDGEDDTCYGEDNAFAPQQRPEKKPKIVTKPTPYIIGIDLGMWGSGRACAASDTDPPAVNAEQGWPGTHTTAFKAPSMVAFADDNPGHNLYRRSAKDVVGFKIDVGMNVCAFFKKSLDDRARSTPFDNPILDEGIARNLVSTGTPAKDKRAAMAVLKYIVDYEIGELKKAIGNDAYKNTKITYVLTHPAACSPQGKQNLEDLAHEAGLDKRRGDKIKLLSESQAACQSGFVSQMSKHGNGAWSRDFKEGDWVTTMDIGSLTVDLTTEEIVSNDPVVRLRERLVSEGGRCGTIALHLMLLKAIIEKFGLDEADITPELVGRNSRFHNDCEANFTAFPNEDATPYTFQLVIEPTRNEEDYDADFGELTLNRNEIDQVIEEFLDWPKRLLVDSWTQAQTAGHQLQTTVMCGGGCQIEAVWAKLQTFCNNHDWAITAIRPRDCIAAVIKGAVISELCPTLLGERMLRMSFGIKFKPTRTPEIMQWLQSRGDIIDTRQAKVLNGVPGQLCLNMHAFLHRGKKYEIKVFMFESQQRNPSDPDHPAIDEVSQINLDATNLTNPQRAKLEDYLVSVEDDEVQEDAFIDAVVNLRVDESGRLFFEAKYDGLVLGKGKLRINATKLPNYGDGKGSR